MQATYSPYNKTYKFIVLQNQIAHVRNKKSVHSVGQSNISLSSSKQNSLSKHNKLKIMSSTGLSKHKISKNLSAKEDIQSLSSSICFIEPYRQIHKNASFDKKVKLERALENERFAKKLVNTSSSVVTKDQSFSAFQDHLLYKSIARRYDDDGHRKNLVVPPKNSLTASAVSQMRKELVELCTLNLKANTYRQKYANQNWINRRKNDGPKRQVIRLS